MDLAYNRWASEVVKIVQDISESHFVAFDLEFSGIGRSSKQRPPGKPSLQEIYEESKAAAAKYQILQVGLAIVKEDVLKGGYVIKPYNVNISPVPTLPERKFTREWTMSSGAVQFLLKNKFDFGLPLSTGIPYLSRAEEVQARMALSGEEDRKRPDMILKPEDENLIKHIRTSIASWQEQPEDVKEKYLNIPNDDRGKGVPGVLNRYQVRLTHQIVQNEFPELKTTSMRDFVQVTNPTKQERERIQTLQNEHINREIGRAVGFRWILEAMVGRDISGMPDEYFLAAISQFSKPKDGQTPFQSFVSDLNYNISRRRRVLIGHNCMTDLVYLHQFFIGELPDQVEDFQDSIHELFPAVVDTKHIASFGTGRWSDTSLEAVEMELRDEPEPKITIPPEFDRYIFNEKPHEAGYDALLTAQIAIKLSAKMEREGKYYEQDTEDAQDSPAPAPKHPEPFGTKEEGYVTASEDLESQQAENTDTKESDPDMTSKTTADNQNSQPPTIENVISTLPNASPLKPTPSTDPTPVIAVKEKKSKSVNLHSSTEVDKVRSAFAATNIYDVLDNASSSDDLISFTDQSSPAQTLRKIRIDELVKAGKLMPRWDGGHGFWQLFGNKLQVNPSKEGVCNL